MKQLHVAALIVGLGLSACSKDKPATVPAAVPSEPAASPPPASAASTPPPSAQVGVSNDVARACQLQFSNVQAAPKFAYDEFELLPEDRNVLDQVATCLIKGPLKGKTVQLIGRADPRGTEEYNLGLGSRRAAQVGAYLQRLGVPQGQLARTTRGDIDAAGSSEAGWSSDRRVDLELRP